VFFSLNRIEDAFMMSVHMAKERSVSDFVALFREASPKFRFCGVTGGYDGAFQSLLEFEYIGH
jgi:6-hydroxytryprostatin B O-methyltransferase